MDGSTELERLTEYTANALRSISISDPSTVPLDVRGTSVSLAIPLDEGDASRHPSGLAPALGESISLSRDAQAGSAYGRQREPIRRDSLKRREALFKGKEGSRRRQRWENGSC